MKTDFSKIVFDENRHHYQMNGIELTSVTGFIKQFQKPFDRNLVANRVAERDNRPVADVLAEWDAKREAGLALGIRVHQHIQQILLGEIQVEDPFLSLNDLLPEEQTFNNLWQQLKGSVMINQKYIEWIVGDAKLGIGGTVDTVLFSFQTNQYHIWDWKTGKFDTENKWQTLLEPFTDLDDCKLNYYSLQVNLYRLILERNIDLPIGDSYIVHLSSQGHQIHKAVDLRDRLAAHFSV